jgi:ketosteroid isomerase-like protein
MNMDSAALESVYRRYMTAMTSQDHDTVAAILHPKFESTDPLGVVRDRDGYLELARTEIGPRLAATLSDLVVRVYRDAAATSCVYTMSGEYESGYSPPLPIRVTGGWLRTTGGMWQFVSQQGSYIAGSPEA